MQKNRRKLLFSYVQDNWRVTPRLTLNLGVRWEFYFPETVNGRGQGGFADLNTGAIPRGGLRAIQHRNECSKRLQEYCSSYRRQPTRSIPER